MARDLEVHPLAPDARKTRKKLLDWLIDVPDITLPICGQELEPMMAAAGPKRDQNFANEIWSQEIFSSLAFIIENPDKAKDTLAVHMAGVRGSLKAYQAIVKERPDARWPFLDDLIAKDSKGELEEYVNIAIANCTR